MIKNWISFNESHTNLFTLEKDEIEELFYGMMDEGYTISIEYGFSNENKVYFLPTSTCSCHTCYKIEIGCGNITDVDVTDDFKRAISILSENNTVIVGDGNDKMDFKKFRIKDGFIYLHDDEKYGYDIMEIEMYIIDKKTIELNDLDIINFYELTGVSTKGEKTAYINVTKDNLVDLLVSGRSRDGGYHDILIEGYVPLDNYNSSDYEPDTDSLYRYSLSKENEYLLIDCLIKEIGGVEKTIDLIKMVSSSSLKTNKEIADFLRGERFGETLKYLSNSSEITDVVKETVADFEAKAHADRNYQDIWDAFIRVVDDNIESYDILENDIF
jgi:hypothetical protein